VNSWRRRRTFNSEAYRSRWQKLLRVAEEVEKKADLQPVTKVGAETFFERLGFKPYWYQIELADLFDKSQFLAVRWPRQTGKSFTASALLLKHA